MYGGWAGEIAQGRIAPASMMWAERGRRAPALTVDHMSSPDADAQLAAKDASFVAAADACVRHWDNALPIEVADEERIKFRVCFPLVAHSLNQVAAALVLLRAGQPFVATANTRVAFEHALAAQWVLLTHGGEQRLVRHMEASHLLRAKEFSKAVDDPLELRDIVDRSPADGPARSYSIPMACARFDQSGLLYNLYRHLGQSIHPSLETLRAYLNVNELESHAVDSAGRLHAPPDLCMSLGFGAVMAVDVLERMRRGDCQNGVAAIRLETKRQGAPSSARAP
jgi:hypothetical protein